MDKRLTKEVHIGNRVIGGGNPILIQSMTNTPTEDVAATVAQIKRLEEAGCEIIRCTVPTMETALALKEIKKQISIPVVADIHFDYKLALDSVYAGVDKVRINPGNIGDDSRVKAVADVLEIGKTYQFKVLKIDVESKKVSIGYKQLQAQPWDLAAEKYAEGDVIHGKVVRIVPFGAFVEVEKGIDGLVHVSQISHEFLENPTTALTIGQEIDAKILKLDCAEKKMTLSIKALEPKPENVERKPRAAKAEDGIRKACR